jgi:ABC-2 type transport system permease protein
MEAEINPMVRELKFLTAIWKANLQSAMEYRTAFITQILGMMLNNGFYFIFWVIFFDQFGEVRGWVLNDMFLVFGITATSFGLTAFLFGNAFALSEVIAGGRLDYYLSMPRPVLLHTVASRSISSGLGDISYGIISFLLSGYFTWSGLGRFFVGVMLATTVFASFLIIAHSLTFWLGNASALARLLMNAILTFALYPISLFDGPAKFVLFSLIPAALMGSVPASLVRDLTRQNILGLIFGALIILGLAVLVFHRGLRRYESGSAIQVEV